MHNGTCFPTLYAVYVFYAAKVKILRSRHSEDHDEVYKTANEGLSNSYHLAVKQRFDDIWRWHSCKLSKTHFYFIFSCFINFLRLSNIRCFRFLQLRLPIRERWLQESSSPNSAKVGISGVCIDRRYNEAAKCSVLSVGSTLKRQIRNDANGQRRLCHTLVDV